MALTVHENTDFVYFATLNIDAAGTAEAFAASSTPCKHVIFQPGHENTDDVLVGPSNDVDQATHIGYVIAAAAAGTTPNGLSLSRDKNQQDYDLATWFGDARQTNEDIIVIGIK